MLGHPVYVHQQAIKNRSVARHRWITGPPFCCLDGSHYSCHQCPTHRSSPRGGSVTLWSPCQPVTIMPPCHCTLPGSAWVHGLRAEAGAPFLSFLALFLAWVCLTFTTAATHYIKDRCRRCRSAESGVSAPQHLLRSDLKLAS
jgi:hypothetical protein